MLRIVCIASMAATFSFLLLALVGADNTRAVGGLGGSDLVLRPTRSATLCVGAGQWKLTQV